MHCSKCGKENSNNYRFCVNCGAEFNKEISIQTNQNNISKNNKQPIPKLSWISLWLFCVQFLIGTISYILSIFNNEVTNSIASVIYFLIALCLIASLVTSIISRVQNKDKMSFVLLIVNIICISLFVILMMWLFIYFIINRFISVQS